MVGAAHQRAAAQGRAVRGVAGLILEFRFGDTPCEVHVDGPPEPGSFATYTARLLVQEHDGRALRRVADPEGTPVAFEQADADGALALTAIYLENERTRRVPRAAPTPAPKTKPMATPTAMLSNATPKATPTPTPSALPTPTLNVSPEPLPRVVMETSLVLRGLAKRAGNWRDLAHAAFADEGGHVVAAYALESHLIRPVTVPERHSHLGMPEAVTDGEGHCALKSEPDDAVQVIRSRRSSG